MLNRHREVFFLIAVFTVIRLVVAPSFGLGVDEAHYVLYGLHPDLSYFDHPPLVGWVHAAFIHFFGTSEFLARLPAILLFALASFLAYLFMMRVSHSKRISLLAALALNSSFLFNALSLMLLPESLLFVLIFPLIFLVKRIEEKAAPADFIALGVVLGLAGLAKYTAILFVPPLLIYFICKRRTDLLFHRYLFVSALIALILVAPVFYWNWRNDFMSFRYQGSHVFGFDSLKLGDFFTSLGAQIGFYGPFLFGIAFFGLYKSLRARNDWILLSLLFGGTVLGFHLLASLKDVALPHWAGVFYLLFIPIGVYFLSLQGGKWKKRILNGSVGISLALTLILYVEIGNQWFRFPDFQSPFRDIYGMATIAKEADAILSRSQSLKKGLAVTEWTLGSRMIYYSRPYHREVFVIDNRVDQFDLWQKKSPLGVDLLFVKSHFSDENLAKRFRCGEVRMAKEVDILLNGGKVDHIEYVWCLDFQGERKGNE